MLINISKDAPPNLAIFDENDPLKNLVGMHQREYRERKQRAEDRKNELLLEREERAKKRAAEASKKKQPKKKAGGEPPLNLLISLIGNVKFSIKRIHFRIEDDYFNHYRPVSFGLMIEEVSFSTSDKWWKFSSPLSMLHESLPAENISTTLKDLVVKNIKVYWNSMSEMFIPTSLWQQTKHMERQIFSALDPAFLKQIMV
jgi:hypothetical protein